MNQLQKDIITVLGRKSAMRTTDICEDLMTYGYGASLTWDEYKSHIGKTISKMKAEGHVIGEDRPNPGTKPVRYWALPEADHSEDKLEMVEEAVTAVAPETYRDTWTNPPATEVEFKAAPECTEWKKLLPSKPMSVSKALDAFAETGLPETMLPPFMDGIAAAERHHGIAE